MDKRCTVEKNCEECGVLFLVRPEKVKAGGGRCCTRKCAAVGRIKRGIVPKQPPSLSGSANPAWKGGKPTVRAKGARRASDKKYIQNHIDIIRPRRIVWKKVNRAKKKGVLKPQSCTDCGSTKKTQAHHEDYSRPLDVTWLCVRCHNKRHRQAATPLVTPAITGEAGAGVVRLAERTGESGEAG